MYPKCQTIRAFWHWYLKGGWSRSVTPTVWLIGFPTGRIIQQFPHIDCGSYRLLFGNNLPNVEKRGTLRYTSPWVPIPLKAELLNSPWNFTFDWALIYARPPPRFPALLLWPLRACRGLRLTIRCYNKNTQRFLWIASGRCDLYAFNANGLSPDQD